MKMPTESRTSANNGYARNNLDGTECFIVAGIIMVVAILISEIMDWHKYFAASLKPKRARKLKITYHKCEGSNGLKIRKDPHVIVKRDFPINIVTKSALVIHNSDNLKWSKEFSQTPDYLQIYNDGDAVVLVPTWCDGTTITATGGPLEHVCELKSVHFHWTRTENEDTKHVIDNTAHPMEIDMMFARQRNPNERIVDSGDKRDTANYKAVISFFAKLSKLDNPHLEQLAVATKKIRTPGNQFYLRPFPLCWIAPQFESGFYTYTTPITYLPYTEAIIWILKLDPINISQAQLNKFRKISSTSTALKTNYQKCPLFIQPANNMELYYYE